MKRRLVIITEIISPYRIPLFNALARDPEIDLHVIFLAETDPGLREWKIYKEEIRFSYEVLRSWRSTIGGWTVLLNKGVRHALAMASPAAILCGGYNYPASWQAQRWARRRGVPFFLWSESNLRDLRAGNPTVEWLKAAFLRRCSGFIVPGSAARKYLRANGIQEGAIFTAVNAVDNEFFCAASKRTRENASQLRNDLELPQRYFMFAGRLVREKGVFELLSAYAKLEAPLRDQVGLVFVGDGACRRELEEETISRSLKTVKFSGFAQRELLASYYALSEALVLPTYTDTWGLVINEAMACGLPVIVSRAAGCADDLVTDGWNGFAIPARDVPALTHAMRNLATQSELRTQMSTNSRNRIREFSPQAWSRGISTALESIGASHE